MPNQQPTTRKIEVTRYLKETIVRDVPFDPSLDEKTQLDAAEEKIAQDVDVSEWTIEATDIDSCWDPEL